MLPVEQPEQNQAPVVPAHFYHTRESSLLPQNECVRVVQRHRETAEQKKKAEEEHERRLQLEKQRLLADGQERRRKEREEELHREHVQKMAAEEEKELREAHGETARILAELRDNLTLPAMSLASGFTPPQLRLIFGALAKNRSLKTLCITRMELGKDELQALAGSLRANDVLKSLQLDAAGVNSVGLAALVEGLRDSSVLAQLSLNDNPLCSPNNEGMLMLADALTTNDCLLCVQMLGCGLGVVELDAMSACLERNNTLIQMSLDADPGLPVATVSRFHSLLQRNRATFDAQRLAEEEERRALETHYKEKSAILAQETRRSEERRKTREEREELNVLREELFVAQRAQIEQVDQRWEVGLAREAEARALAKAKKGKKKNK